MRFYLILFFFLSFNAISQNISTIDISFILDNNIKYQQFLKDLNIKKLEIQKQIEKKEENLKTSKNNLEKNSLILSDSIIKNKLDEFSNQVNSYEKFVKIYNNYITDNISKNEKIIINQIAIITQNYAKINNIDIVINSDSYFISSSNYDISNFILENLSKYDIEFKIINQNEYFKN